MDRSGQDWSGETQWQTEEEFWAAVRDERWFSKGAEYWERVQADEDGVLGGFGHLNAQDVAYSKMFMELRVLPRLRAGGALAPKEELVAADCGAGIGRVTRDLLLDYFSFVHVVEQDEHFSAKAAQDLQGKPVEIHTVGLQDYSPQEESLDVVWCQWVLGHLPDAELTEFFRRCGSGLRENGVIVIKENISTSTFFAFDSEDHSITRSDEYWKRCFEDADLELLAESKQRDWPKGMLEVKLYMLAPKQG